MDKKTAIDILESKVVLCGLCGCNEKEEHEYELKYQPHCAVDLYIIYNVKHSRLCIKCKVMTLGTVDINLKTNMVTVLYTYNRTKYSLIWGYRSDLQELKMYGKFDPITQKFICTMCNTNERSLLHNLLKIALNSFESAVQNFGLTLQDFNIDITTI